MQEDQNAPWKDDRAFAFSFLSALDGLSRVVTRPIGLRCIFRNNDAVATYEIQDRYIRVRGPHTYALNSNRSIRSSEMLSEVQPILFGCDVICIDALAMYQGDVRIPLAEIVAHDAVSLALGLVRTLVRGIDFGNPDTESGPPIIGPRLNDAFRVRYVWVKALATARSGQCLLSLEGPSHTDDLKMQNNRIVVDGRTRRINVDLILRRVSGIHTGWWVKTVELRIGENYVLRCDGGEHWGQEMIEAILLKRYEAAVAKETMREFIPNTTMYNARAVANARAMQEIEPLPYAYDPTWKPSDFLEDDLPIAEYLEQNVGSIVIGMMNAENEMITPLLAVPRERLQEWLKRIVTPAPIAIDMTTGEKAMINRAALVRAYVLSTPIEQRAPEDRYPLVHVFVAAQMPGEQAVYDLLPWQPAVAADTNGANASNSRNANSGNATNSRNANTAKASNSRNANGANASNSRNANSVNASNTRNANGANASNSRNANSVNASNTRNANAAEVAPRPPADGSGRSWRRSLYGQNGGARPSRRTSEKVQLSSGKTRNVHINAYGEKSVRVGGRSVRLGQVVSLSARTKAALAKAVLKATSQLGKKGSAAGRKKPKQ